MKFNRTLGGILLVAGTAIGGGMLALPISTGLAGFIPSLCILLLIWAYMTTTAFLFLEVNLWLKEDTNLVSMAEHTLGVIGKIISWFIYLFLLYALTTAYLAGCGNMFLNSLSSWFNASLPSWVGPLPFLILFGSCVYLGTRPVDYINRLLMIGLIVVYVFMGVLIVPNLSYTNFEHSNWFLLLPAVSVVVTSFGFHIIIPSLTTYLRYDLKKLKRTLFWGGLLPLIIYVFWVLLILGVLPLEGKNGLYAVLANGNPEINMIASLSECLKNPWIAICARTFSYFAILTSFLGVSLSLVDFLGDGLQIKKTGKGRLLAAVLTFAPPMIIAITNVNVFLSALKYAGIFVATLLGIFPAAMAWAGRYRLKKKGEYRVFGGKILLILIIVFSLAVIIVDVLDQLGVF